MVKWFKKEIERALFQLFEPCKTTSKLENSVNIKYIEISSSVTKLPKFNSGKMFNTENEKRFLSLHENRSQKPKQPIFFPLIYD